MKEFEVFLSLEEVVRAPAIATAAGTKALGLGTPIWPHQYVPQSWECWNCATTLGQHSSSNLSKLWSDTRFMCELFKRNDCNLMETRLENKIRKNSIGCSDEVYSGACVFRDAEPPQPQSTTSWLCKKYSPLHPNK